MVDGGKKGSRRPMVERKKREFARWTKGPVAKTKNRLHRGILGNSNCSSFKERPQHLRFVFTWKLFPRMDRRWAKLGVKRDQDGREVGTD